VTIPHNPEITSLKPFEYIYGRYSQNISESLYRKETSTDLHPFREILRLKLSALLLESKPADGGQKLKIRRYLSRRDILACFPLHTPLNLAQLKSSWLPWKVYPWAIPLEDIKEYYSEKIAMYFYFVGHLAQWLIAPAVIGIPFQIAVFALNDYSAPFIPAFSFFVSVWAIVTLELWKRKESTIGKITPISSFLDLGLSLYLSSQPCIGGCPSLKRRNWIVANTEEKRSYPSSRERKSNSFLGNSIYGNRDLDSML
jgi:hypothetical protein